MRLNRTALREVVVVFRPQPSGASTIAASGGRRSTSDCPKSCHGTGCVSARAIVG
jgi:hypothetical protein